MMTIFRSVIHRELGKFQQNKGIHTKTSIDGILENFECLRTDEYVFESENNGVVPPFACGFSKVSGQSHFLASADEDGSVVIFNTNRTGPTAMVKEWLAHTNAIFDLDWMTGEDKLLTASGDQTTVLWDVKAEDKLSTFKGHTSSIKSVRFRKGDSAVFATGSRDGHIMVWDKRCNKRGKDGSLSPVNILRNAHVAPITASTPKQRRRRSKVQSSQDSQQSVTAVLFQDENVLASAGAVDGIVKLWDLRKNYSTVKNGPQPKHQFPYAGTSVRKHGFSSLVCDSTGTNLFASCTDDFVYQYNCINGSSQPVNCFRGHQNSTFYVKAALSPDDMHLLSGSSDNSAYIWKVNEPFASPLLLKGHLGEVTTVLWHPTDFTKIVTLSDDNTLRIWRIIRRVSPPEQGVVIGNAERTHKEIGITASSVLFSSPKSSSRFRCKSPSTPVTPKSNKTPASPLATYYQSPAARSLQVASPNRSAGNMCKGLPAGAAKSSPKYTSPSIKNWLAKRSPKASPSPRKSPRKLIISPIKSPLSNATMTAPGKGVKRKLDVANEAALSTGQEKGVKRKPGDCEVTELGKPIGDGVTLPSTPGRGLKRKLDACDNDSDNILNKSNKKRIIGEKNTEENLGKINKSPVKSPIKEEEASRVFSVVNSNTDNKELTPQAKKSARKPLFVSKADCENATPLADEEDLVTPVKATGLALPFQNYSSPTSNLPNSIHDPLPRNTLVNTDGDGESPKAKRCIDWLTKIRLEKDSPNRDSDLLTSSSPSRALVALHKLESPSNRKRRFRTVENSQEMSGCNSRGNSRPSSPATIQSPGKTILQYFSPKSAKKKT